MNKRRLNSWIVLCGALLIVFAYVYYQHIHDKQLSQRIYQQLQQIDQQLDQLQESANYMQQHKTTNMALIDTFKQINANNFKQLQPVFLQRINALTYAPAVESNLIRLVSVSNGKEFKRQRKLIKAQLRVLQYKHNQHLVQFKQQIAGLTVLVKQLNGQVDKIYATDLQNLELAKLKFISNKLSQTAQDVSESLITEIVDDVLDKNDRESGEIGEN